MSNEVDRHKNALRWHHTTFNQLSDRQAVQLHTHCEKPRKTPQTARVRTPDEAPVSSEHALCQEEDRLKPTCMTRSEHEQGKQKRKDTKRGSREGPRAKTSKESAGVSPNDTSRATTVDSRRQHKTIDPSSPPREAVQNVTQRGDETSEKSRLTDNAEEVKPRRRRAQPHAARHLHDALRPERADGGRGKWTTTRRGEPKGGQVQEKANAHRRPRRTHEHRREGPGSEIAARTQGRQKVKQDPVHQTEEDETAKGDDQRKRTPKEDTPTKMRSARARNLRTKRQPGAK